MQTLKTSARLRLIVNVLRLLQQGKEVSALRRRQLLPFRLRRRRLRLRRTPPLRPKKQRPRPQLWRTRRGSKGWIERARRSKRVISMRR
jgi:hypothetical protein